MSEHMVCVRCGVRLGWWYGRTWRHEGGTRRGCGQPAIPVTEATYRQTAESFRARLGRAATPAEVWELVRDQIEQAS